jgi:hypothetical protein
MPYYGIGVSKASEEAKSQSHAAPDKTIATRGSAYLIYEFDISQGCPSTAAIEKTRRTDG